jgi:hypothetical protein
MTAWPGNAYLLPATYGLGGGLFARRPLGHTLFLIIIRSTGEDLASASGTFYSHLQAKHGLTVTAFRSPVQCSST